MRGVDIVIYDDFDRPIAAVKVTGSNETPQSEANALMDEVADRMGGSSLRYIVLVARDRTYIRRIDPQPKLFTVDTPTLLASYFTGSDTTVATVPPDAFDFTVAAWLFSLRGEGPAHPVVNESGLDALMSRGRLAFANVA